MPSSNRTAYNVAEIEPHLTYSGSSQWLRGVAVHCGSRPGNEDIFITNAFDTGKALAKAGFGIRYGGGQAGCMGAVARGALDAGGDVHGVTLKFFDGVQGEGLKGMETSYAETIAVRMRKIRAPTQAAVVLPGSVGTLQEGTEWLHARNGIVKPQIIVNLNGYYNGWVEYLEHRAAQPDGHDLKNRFHVVASGEEAAEKLRELNSKPAIPEALRPAPRAARNHVDMHEGVIVAKKGHISAMFDVMSLFCAYDLCNVPNQNLFPHRNYGEVIRPIVFNQATGQFPGVKAQFETVFNKGFANADRQRLVHFAHTDAELNEALERLNAAGPVPPLALKAIHNEALGRAHQADNTLTLQ